MVMLVGAAGAWAATPTEQHFIWDEANARMATARTEKDFLLAARSYAKLVNAGVHNGPLFYNLGTALLKGRHYDDAGAALLRAERYAGSDPDIRRNLLLAAARDDKHAEVSLPWYRYFLFWHYGLGLHARTTIAVAAFAVFWLALTARLLGARRLDRPFIGLSLLVLVLYGSSMATSLNQEANARPVTVRLEAPPPRPAQPAKTPPAPAAEAKPEARK